MGFVLYEQLNSFSFYQNVEQVKWVHVKLVKVVHSLLSMNTTLEIVLFKISDYNGNSIVLVILLDAL